MKIKTLIVFTATLFLGLFLFVESSLAVVLKNVTTRPINVTLTGGRTISIASQGTAEVTEREASTPSIQRLIRSNSLIVVVTQPARPAR